MHKTDLTSYNKYFQTYSGRRLLEKHSLDEFGIWQVYGEDSNPDFGGQHSQPDLGLFEGTLNDVVSYAVKLPRFWQWGAGGSFKKVTITPLADGEH